MRYYVSDFVTEIFMLEFGYFSNSDHHSDNFQNVS